MRKKFWKAAVLGSTLGLAVCLMPGCAKQSSSASTDNGNSSAQLASDEVSNMGVDEGTVMSNASSLGKTVAAADTTYINWTVDPYHWDTLSQSFVRTASFTTAKGYVRTRTDTITFRDSSGNALRFPSMAGLATIHHVRHVIQSKGDITATLDINVIDSLKKGADTTFVKNGTMTGACDSQVLKTGVISNVTRLYANGFWQFPYQGTIATDLPRYDFTVQFTGNNQATVTITNLVTGKTRVVNLTVDDR